MKDELTKITIGSYDGLLPFVKKTMANFADTYMPGLDDSMIGWLDLTSFLTWKGHIWLFPRQADISLKDKNYSFTI